MESNIKNLPEGEYYSEVGHSQLYPWMMVKKTPKTMVLAKVQVDPDPEWKEKMDYRPGGFCGHMANQGEQTWLYKGIDYGNQVRIYKTKMGWSKNGVKFVSGAVEFYDYNF